MKELSKLPHFIRTAAKAWRRIVYDKTALDITDPANIENGRSLDNIGFDVRGDFVPIAAATNKLFYDAFLDDELRGEEGGTCPLGIPEWTEILGPPHVPTNWKQPYRQLWRSDVDNEVKSTNFVLMHRRLPTRLQINHRKPEDQKRCLLCGQHMETNEHVFVQCHQTARFWRSIGINRPAAKIFATDKASLVAKFIIWHTRCQLSMGFQATSIREAYDKTLAEMGIRRHRPP